MADLFTENRFFHAHTIPRGRRGHSRARGTGQRPGHAPSPPTQCHWPWLSPALPMSKCPGHHPGWSHGNSKAEGPGPSSPRKAGSQPTPSLTTRIQAPTAEQSSCLQAGTASPRDLHLSGAKCTYVHARTPTCTQVCTQTCTHTVCTTPGGAKSLK